MALSTYLPVADTLAAEASATNRDVPIFMAHGLDDPLIPLERARMSRKLLESAAYRVEWPEYPMEHSRCAKEIAGTGSCLTRVMTSSSRSAPGSRCAAAAGASGGPVRH